MVGTGTALILAFFRGAIKQTITHVQKCAFLSLTVYTYDGGYETKNVCFNNNNKIKGNGKLIMFILNCTLLHNQNDGWTVT
jgi:hypothetical protein